jgi:hypothetical protein
MMDKLFGGREAALGALSDLVASREPGSRELKYAKELRRIVLNEKTLNLHGVLRADPFCTITIKAAASPAVLLSQVGEPSRNTEGEDQLLRCALDTIDLGKSYLSLIDDIDFRAAVCVTLPALQFPETPRATPLSKLFYAKVDRTSASAWSFTV